MKARDHKRVRVQLSCERLDDRVVPVVVSAFGNFQSATAVFNNAIIGTPQNGVFFTPQGNVPPPTVASSTFAPIAGFGGFFTTAGRGGGGTFQTVSTDVAFTGSPLAPTVLTSSLIPSFATFFPLPTTITFSPVPSFMTFSPTVSTSPVGALRSFGGYTPVLNVGQPTITLNSTSAAASSTVISTPGTVPIVGLGTPVGTGLTTITAPVSFESTPPSVTQQGSLISGSRAAVPPVATGALGTIPIQRTATPASLFPSVTYGAIVPGGSLLGAFMPISNLFAV